MEKILILGPLLPGLAQICPLSLNRFSWFLLLINVRHCLKLCNCMRCMHFQWNIIIQTQENGEKPHFVPVVRLVFSKIWLCLDIMISYHRVQYQKKIMIQSLENLLMDGRTDRQTDEIGFMVRCPTNVRRPTCKYRTS